MKNRYRIYAYEGGVHDGRVVDIQEFESIRFGGKRWEHAVNTYLDKGFTVRVEKMENTANHQNVYTK